MPYELIGRISHPPTRAAEKAFDRDLIASEGACPPLVALCRRGETDETRAARRPRRWATSRRTR